MPTKSLTGASEEQQIDAAVASQLQEQADQRQADAATAALVAVQRQRQREEEQRQADAAVERQRQEEEEEEDQRQATAEADRRRFEAQAARLAAVRDRTLHRLKGQPIRETFKPQVSFARRKVQLAQRQGFAVAAANAVQHRPQFVQTAASSSSTPKLSATATKTPIKRTIATHRQTIQLKSPIVGRVGRRRATAAKKTTAANGLKLTTQTTDTAATAVQITVNNTTESGTLSVQADEPSDSPEFHGFPTSETKADHSSDSDAVPRMRRTTRNTKRNNRMSDGDEDEHNEQAATDEAKAIAEKIEHTTTATPTTVDKPVPIDVEPPTVASEAPPPPPEQTSYTSSYTSAVATTSKYSVQVRDLFGEALSDSDYIDTPTKQTGQVDRQPYEQQHNQQCFSDVPAALALMPTPQKTSTPNEEEQQKRNAAHAHAPVGTAAASISFDRTLMQPQPQPPIKLPAKKRKNEIPSTAPVAVLSNPMLAALETPIKIDSPSAAPSTSNRIPVAVDCRPISATERTAGEMPTNHCVQSATTATAKRVVATQATIGASAAATDDEQDDCSSNSSDLYDDCTLHRANDRHPHVGYMELKRSSSNSNKSTAVSVAPPAALKIRPLTLQLDGTVVRLCATEPLVLYEIGPPEPRAAAAAAASVKVRPPQATHKKASRKSGADEKLQSSTPVPQMRVSYKQRNPPNQATSAAPAVTTER